MCHTSISFFFGLVLLMAPESGSMSVSVQVVELPQVHGTMLLAKVQTVDGPSLCPSAFL